MEYGNVLYTITMLISASGQCIVTLQIECALLSNLCKSIIQSGITHLGLFHLLQLSFRGSLSLHSDKLPNLFLLIPSLCKRMSRFSMVLKRIKYLTGKFIKYAQDALL